MPLIYFPYVTVIYQSRYFNVEITASRIKNLKVLKFYLSVLISLTIQYLYKGSIKWYLVLHFKDLLFARELSDSYAIIYSFLDSVGVSLPSIGFLFSYTSKLLCLDKNNFVGNRGLMI